MSYGTGTRSYNRSPEKRAIDKERRQVTAAYEAKPVEEKEIQALMCRCPQRPWPHETFVHRELWHEAHRWPELQTRWPHSLAFELKEMYWPGQPPEERRAGGAT